MNFRDLSYGRKNNYFSSLELLQLSTTWRNFGPAMLFYASELHYFLLHNIFMTVIILQMADLQRKHILNEYQLKSN